MINKGLVYEEKINNLLVAKNLLTPALKTRLKQTGNDSGFVHSGKEFFLELKNATAPDFGAKKIIYDHWKNVWKWNEVDDMSQLFDKIGILQKARKFTPKKHVIPDGKITKADKKFDRRNFANKITETDLEVSALGLSGAKILHQYYAKKDCFYIQVEGKGFYYLSEDKAELGVPQFMPSVVFRLRAKTHSSRIVSNYSFRVVITASRRTFGDSIFDLDNPNKFPPI